VRFAYADPPYIGQAHLYRGVDANAAEVDHAALIADLERGFPDGWSLSLSSPTLREVLNLCPDGVRVGAWVKPFCSFKPGVGVAYAWEPVIFKGGRKRTREQDTVRDWVSANILLKKGMPGAKPPAFSEWVFQVLNAEDGDELVDVFPGSGAVGRQWEAWSKRRHPSALELDMLDMSSRKHASGTGGAASQGTK